MRCALLVVLFCACGDGAPGDRGADGGGCTFDERDDGQVIVTCADGTTATVAPGRDGTDGEDGDPGTDGRDGEDAPRVLVHVEAILPGPECAAGGALVSTGVDADGDGVLAESEREETRRVCLGGEVCDTLYGDLALRDAASLSRLRDANCAAVSGSVTVDIPALTDLSALGSLRSIGGDLTLIGTGLTDLAQLAGLDALGGLSIRGAPSLGSLRGLERITTLRLLELVDAPLLETTAALEQLASVGRVRVERVGLVTFDLPALTAVAGDVELRSLDRLTSAPGLSRLQETRSLVLRGLPLLDRVDFLGELRATFGNLELQELPLLRSAAGLERLETVAVSLVIGDTGLTALALPALRQVGGDFLLRGNPSLSDLRGLESLVAVDRLLLNNTRLVSLAGLENLASVNGIRLNTSPLLADISALRGIADVRDDVRITGTALTSLAGLEDIADLGSLTLEDNAQLATLGGLQNVVELRTLRLARNGTVSLTGLTGLSRITTRLELIDNAQLVDVSELVDLQLGPFGLVITGNPRLPTCEVDALRAAWSLIRPITDLLVTGTDDTAVCN